MSAVVVSVATYLHRDAREMQQFCHGTLQIPAVTFVDLGGLFSAFFTDVLCLHVTGLLLAFLIQMFFLTSLFEFSMPFVFMVSDPTSFSWGLVSYVLSDHTTITFSYYFT
jgi:hypothetical protein